MYAWEKGIKGKDETRGGRTPQRLILVEQVQGWLKDHFLNQKDSHALEKRQAWEGCREKGKGGVKSIFLRWILTLHNLKHLKGKGE